MGIEEGKVGLWAWLVIVKEVHESGLHLVGKLAR